MESNLVTIFQFLASISYDATGWSISLKEDSVVTDTKAGSAISSGVT